MKKIIISLILTITALFLCGCDFREPDRQYMAAALGFDQKDGGMQVSVETIVINSESNEEQIKTEVFSAQGESPEECVYNLGKSLAKKMTFSHCGIIAVGDTLSSRQLLKVTEYCRNEQEINLSAYLVSTADCKELLSKKATSTLALGYELMSALEYSTVENGIMYGSRIYEVEDAFTKNTPAFLLPRFKTQEDSFSLSGSRLYLSGSAQAELNGDETLIYSIIRNANRGGKINTEDGVYNVDAPFTYFEAELDGDEVMISLDIRIPPDGADSTLCSYIGSAATAIVNRLPNELFGFADRIYSKDKALWNKINRDKLLADAQTQVTCKIRRREDEG